MVLRDEVTDEVKNQKHHVFTTVMPMATKLGKAVVYNEDLPTIESHNL